MAKYKLEYIWLDGYEPVPNLRGKTQIKEFDAFPKLEQLPMWGFDGSSTRQAPGGSTRRSGPWRCQAAASSCSRKRSRSCCACMAAALAYRL